MSRTSRERRLPLALRRPAWLAGLAAVAVFATAAALLGSWQWDRGEATDRRDAAVAAHWDLAPTYPEDVLVAGAVPTAAEWTPVLLVGRYEPASVLVRNRPVDGRPGLLVVSPFRLDRPTGEPARDTVWVVRGWVPAGDEVTPPEPPTGRTSVTVRVRAAELPSGRAAPAGQAYRVTPVELAAAASRAPGPAGEPTEALGSAVAGYGVLADGEPGADGLTVLARPARDPGPHLAYALQWWAFALAGFAIWLVFYRRAAREETAQDRPGGGRSPGAEQDAPVRERVRTGSDPWTYRPGE
ncbi:MAG: SURF1 family protein [Kineosporiaceae bacterium]